MGPSGGEALGAALAGERGGGDSGSVEIHLYVRPLPANRSPSEIEKVWETALAVLREVEHRYVWHGGAALGRRRAWRQVGRGHWVAVLRYRDNVQDEWFAVFCIYRLTTASTNLVAALRDTHDGEFLLVEAAEHLPDWLASEDDGAGRVFIHRGTLRIIPTPQLVSSQAGPVLIPKAGNLTADSKATELALQLIVDPVLGQRITLAPPLIQNVVEQRVNAFNDKNWDAENVMVSCLVPPKVAAMLSGPFASESLALAVHSFIERDALEMRRAEKLELLCPPDHQEPISFAPITVALTRFMLSRLLSSRLSPPMRLGPWGDVKDTCFSQRSVGDRLTLGLEIGLCAARKSTTALDLEQDDFESWNQYLQKAVEGLDTDSSERLKTELSEYDAFHARYRNREQLDLRLVLGYYNRLRSINSVTKCKSLTKPGDKATEGFDLNSAALVDAPELQDRGVGNEEAEIDRGATALRSLLSTSSSIHGIEVGEDVTGVDFDPERFRNITLRAIGEVPDDGDSDTSSEDIELSRDVDEIRNSLHSLMGGVMSQMDQELDSRGISLTKSLSAGAGQDASSASKSIGSEAPDELDIDMNLVKNLLASVGAQDNEPGPVTNILGSLGVAPTKPS